MGTRGGDSSVSPGSVVVWVQVGIGDAIEAPLLVGLPAQGWDGIGNAS